MTEQLLDTDLDFGSTPLLLGDIPAHYSLETISSMAQESELVEHDNIVLAFTPNNWVDIRTGVPVEILPDQVILLRRQKMETNRLCSWKRVTSFNNGKSCTGRGLFYPEFEFVADPPWMNDEANKKEMKNHKAKMKNISKFEWKPIMSKKQLKHEYQFRNLVGDVIPVEDTEKEKQREAFLIAAKEAKILGGNNNGSSSTPRGGTGGHGKKVTTGGKILGGNNNGSSSTPRGGTGGDGKKVTTGGPNDDEGKNCKKKNTTEKLKPTFCCLENLKSGLLREDHYPHIENTIKDNVNPSIFHRVNGHTKTDKDIEPNYFLAGKGKGLNDNARYSKQQLEFIIKKLRDKLTRDWMGSVLAVHATAEDLIEISFLLETVDSELGLFCYMSLLAKDDWLVDHFGLRKLSQLWGVKRQFAEEEEEEDEEFAGSRMGMMQNEDVSNNPNVKTWIFFLFAPAWVKLRVTDAYYTTHPREAGSLFRMSGPGGSILYSLSHG